ncbi:plasmid replication initiation factor [Geobacter luticola]|uniref:Plasmid replication initiation factor n=2 Tax=Geomobilimonas luticola TaxID=1114878 RepID=A0ABS5SJT4_9BACT|nr:plasmid replication initiation factor [Geomobilimonas luticola]MBT0654777.1 plasmid replication initiation factor [Geomobilimonas luticola]
MAQSVTRHAQNPPVENFQFLSCGIDTLDLGLFVSWDTSWEKTKAFLAEKKDSSQGTGGLLDETDIGREFLHQPGGKPPNYRYQLQFPEYRLYIAISDKFGTSPNVYVTINAETLWHVGFTTILELLEFDLLNFGGSIERIQPSRCDLCADFKLSSPLSFSLLEILRVSRSRKVRMITNDSALETYYCGSAGSPVQVRIYDKGTEILKSNKQWFLPIWGLDDPAGVWRVEFQLRRPFLHQYRITTLDDLWQRIGAMWLYLTGEWFSLRLPDNEKTERRTIDPWWLAVQECRQRFGALSDARRTFTCDTVEPIQRTLAHIIGRLISISAQSGIKDRKEAINHLCTLLHDKTDDRKFSEEYRKKSIKLGYRGKLGGSDDDES